MGEQQAFAADRLCPPFMAKVARYGTFSEAEFAQLDDCLAFCRCGEAEGEHYILSIKDAEGDLYTRGPEPGPTSLMRTLERAPEKYYPWEEEQDGESTDRR